MPRVLCLFLVVLAASVALSGCVSSPVERADDSGDTTGTTGPRTLPWGLIDCSYVVAAIPVDEQALGALLPEGFEPAGFSPLAGVELGAVLGAEAFICDAGATLDGTMRPMPYGSFFTSATPPPDLSNEPVDETYVKWDVLVPDEPRRNALQSSGAAARDGATLLSIVDQPGGSRIVDAELDLGGLGTFQFFGTVPPASNNGEFTFIEYQAAEAGLVAWTGLATLTGGSTGYGTVLLEPGSWPAQLVGARATPAIFIVGSFTFSQARIDLPS